MKSKKLWREEETNGDKKRDTNKYRDKENEDKEKTKRIKEG